MSDEYPSNWTSIPALDDSDGVLNSNNITIEDNECRIDSRFIGAGSWAVRRLGGIELAEQLVNAVRLKHPDSDYCYDGAMVFRGIIFEYFISSGKMNNRNVHIYNAELIGPCADTAPNLKKFFLALWQHRANHANTVINSIINS